MAKSIMIQGTMSSAGKSFLAAGLCRILKQDGYRVMPFKSQNMALNSYITNEGLEMGRAQVMQAEAAGMEPSVLMNPILLKPTTDTGSQVIVNGTVLGNMSAREYFACKTDFIGDIMSAYKELKKKADIIVIEGAGSPAEINLKKNDIVNMGLAKMVKAPVILAGDIDRGGVFAQLLGTQMLLDKDEQSYLKGMIINKFRGDKSILDPGTKMLEEKSNIPVVGVVPYMQILLDDEDSLTNRFNHKEVNDIDIAVIRFPRISNFTDFSVFEMIDGVSIRYVDSTAELLNPDMIILPGSKNTMGDLKWMRQNGLEAAILRRQKNTLIFGICGGFQILGERISDPYRVEEGGMIEGMHLLPFTTVLEKCKTRTRVKGHFQTLDGVLRGLSNKQIEGYEIHMGISECSKTNMERSMNLCSLKDENGNNTKIDGMQRNNIYGSYVHGIFDEGDIARCIVETLATQKGISFTSDRKIDYRDFKESQYDKLANTLRDHLDMQAIYEIIENGV